MIFLVFSFQFSVFRETSNFKLQKAIAGRPYSNFKLQKAIAGRPY